MQGNNRTPLPFAQVRDLLDKAVQSALPALLGKAVRTGQVEGHDPEVSNAVGVVTGAGVNDEGHLWLELQIDGYPTLVAVWLSELE